MKYYLKYETLSRMFYVIDSVIKECIDEQVIPDLELSDDDYKRLGCQVPAEDAPRIGFLMGRSGDCYSADWNYLLAIAKTGVRIVFLTYHHCTVQLQSCDGLVLPGGAFDSSELYYTDPKNDKQYASLRQMAYSVCVQTALENEIPILGICAGAQMVAGELGLKMYRSFDYVETPIQHKSNKPEAHRLNVFPDTPLAKIFDGDNMFFVNSRHNELLVPWRVQKELWAENNNISAKYACLALDLYAEANDGTPEAWGNAKKHILCVQWHPEDMAAAGDDKMQRIYQWLADESKKCHASEAAA